VTWDPTNTSLNVGLSNSNLTATGLIDRTVGVAVDLTNQLIWFRNGQTNRWNASNTANPATGAGGISFTPSSGLFPMGSIDVNSSGDQVVVANFGASAFAWAAPSGFSSWNVAAGSATTWNPSDKNSSVTLSNGNLTYTSSAAGSYVAVRATNSLSSGKAYYEFTWTSLPASNSFGVIGIGSSSASLSNYVGSTPTYSIGIQDAGTIYGGSGSGDTSLLISSDDFFSTVLGTQSRSSGKYYFEVGITAVGSSENDHVGISEDNVAVFGAAPGVTSYGYSYNVWHGQLFYNNSQVQTGDGATTGNTLGVAVDLTNQLIWFYSNKSGANRWNASGTANPATGTGGWSISSLSGAVFPSFSAYEHDSSASYVANFNGIATFVFAVPSGFATWETAPAGEANGQASVSGVGLGGMLGVGTANGQASVLGVGIQAVVATGVANGQASVSGIGLSPGIGVANGQATVAGFSSLLAPAGNFPILAGMGWPRHKKPNLNTIVAQHPSARDVRVPLWTYPLWDFEVLFNGLDGQSPGRGAMGSKSFQTLFNFFMSLGGQWAQFLYVDPDDFDAVGQPLGIGDGATTNFVMTHTIGALIEPVGWATSVSAVYLNGTALGSGYRIVTPNTLALTSAPGVGVAVTADFLYAFVCRLTDDSVDFEQFMSNIWSVKSLKFRSVRVD
jgi:hypothetical protein